MEQLIFETTLLRLRPFEQSDLATFVAYRNDESVARYQGWDIPYTLEQAQEFLQGQPQMDVDVPGEWRQLVIEQKSDRVVLGECAYKLSKDSQQAEIGCTIASQYWRSGYAGEATLRLLAHLFDELKLHRVYANCDVENLPAVSALDNAGFRREAHFVENLWFKGRWSSEYWYAMLASEWDIKKFILK